MDPNETVQKLLQQGRTPLLALARLKGAAFFVVLNACSSGIFCFIFYFGVLMQSWGGLECGIRLIWGRLGLCLGSHGLVPVDDPVGGFGCWVYFILYFEICV